MKITIQIQDPTPQVLRYLLGLGSVTLNESTKEEPLIEEMDAHQKAILSDAMDRVHQSGESPLISTFSKSSLSGQIRDAVYARMCAQNGTAMRSELVELIESMFPEKPKESLGKLLDQVSYRMALTKTKGQWFLPKQAVLPID